MACNRTLSPRPKNHSNPSMGLAHEVAVLVLLSFDIVCGASLYSSMNNKPHQPITFDCGASHLSPETALSESGHTLEVLRPIVSLRGDALCYG
jgi:hypothetical protein